MCLMVYLGTDVPVAGFGAVAEGAVGLDAGEVLRPAALSGKAHVARICDRVATGWNCSCIFLDAAVPWEDPDLADDEDADIRRAAYSGLRRIAEAALAADPKAAIFSCWSGDEGRAPSIRRALAPADLKADRYIFDDVQDGGSGGNPPVLIRLAQGEGADVR